MGQGYSSGATDGVHKIRVGAAGDRTQSGAGGSMDSAEAFSQYPVFVGLLVCVDIMLAGFSYAEARYHLQLDRVMQST